MKKLLFLLLLLPLAGFSQEPTDSLKKKKVEIGITFSPDIAYRTLKADADSKDIKDFRDTLETPKFGYTVGANIEFKLGKKLNLEAAVLYSDRGERTKPEAVTTGTVSQEPAKYSYIFHYHYLDIPVKADYFLVNKKLRFYVTAGVSADFYLGSAETILSNYNHGREKKSSSYDPNFSKVNFGFLAGCGIRYPVGKRTDLLVEPVYRRSITAVNSAPIRSYLYSGGLTVGLYYNL